MSLTSIKEVFALFDRDADGFIPTRDVAMAIRATGFNPSDKELDEMLAGKDDFNFSFEDFKKLVEPHLAGKDTLKLLEDAFKPFDRDGSGKISSAELKHVLLNLTEMGSLVESLIGEADPSNSGTINYKQLSQLLMG